MASLAGSQACYNHVTTIAATCRQREGNPTYGQNDTVYLWPIYLYLPLLTLLPSLPFLDPSSV